MTLTEWKDVAQIASDIVVALSASAGGIWAIARYIRERTDEAALDIDIDRRSVSQGSDHLVMLDIVLTNKGKTKLQAKAARDVKTGFAYSDGVEQLQHSRSLQLRQVQVWNANSNRHLDWFDSTLLQPIAGLSSEINLLTV